MVEVPDGEKKRVKVFFGQFRHFDAISTDDTRRLAAIVRVAKCSILGKLGNPRRILPDQG